MRKTIILCDICGKETGETEPVLGYDLCDKCRQKVREHIEFMQTMQTASVAPEVRQETENVPFTEDVKPAESADATETGANEGRKPWGKIDWTYADNLKRQGYSNKEIAERTGIGYKTVHGHYNRSDKT